MHRRVVLLSAAALALAGALVPAGADDYVVKPFDLGELVLRLSWRLVAAVRPALVARGERRLHGGRVRGQYIYVSPRHGVVVVKSAVAGGRPDQEEALTAFRAEAAEVARTR
jgi:DNA-binding response OmpR family regulator